MQKLNHSQCDDFLIYSAYDQPKKRVRVTFSTKGRTKQSFKAECDINNIMARFLKSGVLDFTQKNQPRYGDVTGIQYQNCMQIVAGARSMFNELPAQLRDRFDNEPALFFSFVQNPRNREECEEMGLLKAPPAPVGDPPVGDVPAKGAEKKGATKPQAKPGGEPPAPKDQLLT